MADKDMTRTTFLLCKYGDRTMIVNSDDPEVVKAKAEKRGWRQEGTDWICDHHPVSS